MQHGPADIAIRYGAKQPAIIVDNDLEQVRRGIDALEHLLNRRLWATRVATNICDRMHQE